MNRSIFSLIVVLVLITSLMVSQAADGRPRRVQPDNYQPYLTNEDSSTFGGLTINDSLQKIVIYFIIYYTAAL
jgi:hypothetical protein